MLMNMSHYYAACRICHRPKSQVKLSSRGKCHACALGNVMAAAAAGVAAMEMAHEPAGLKQAGQTMFESLNESRST